MDGHFTHLIKNSRLKKHVTRVTGVTHHDNCAVINHLSVTPSGNTDHEHHVTCVTIDTKTLAANYTTGSKEKQCSSHSVTMQPNVSTACSPMVTQVTPLHQTYHDLCLEWICHNSRSTIGICTGCGAMTGRDAIAAWGGHCFHWNDDAHNCLTPYIKERMPEARNKLGINDVKGAQYE